MTGFIVIAPFFILYQTFKSEKLIITITDVFVWGGQNKHEEDISIIFSRSINP